MKKHRSLETELEGLRNSRDGLRAYFARKKAGLLEKHIERLEIDIEKLRHKSNTLMQEEAVLIGERDELKQAITKNGGDQLDAIRSELASLESDKNRRLERFETYQQLCAGMGLKKVGNSDVFVENRKEAKHLLMDLKQRADDLQNQRIEAEVELRDAKEENDGLSAEIESLKKRKNNIDPRQIDLRNRLCEALDASESEFPFAGELVKVKEEETEWEGAIERVLHNFALSLLVPSSRYKDVTQWVDSTNLRGRLVYFKVNVEEEFRRNSIVVGTLPTKVQVKNDSPFRPWLEHQLHTRFEYQCCEDMERFRKVPRGLTRFGQIKGSSSRHEKDDRYNLNDRSRYVLGWTNTAKIRALQQHQKVAEKTMANLTEILEDLSGKTIKVEQEKNSLNNILFIKSWEEMDWQPLSVRIDHLEKELAKLEKSSDRLKTLTQSLSQLEENLHKLKTELDKVKSKTAGTEERCNIFRKQLAEQEEIVAKEGSVSAEIISSLSQIIAEILSGAVLTVENCDHQQQMVREELQRRIDALNKKIKNLDEKILTKMTGFRIDYPVETREFDSSIDAGSEYIALLEHLKADDLPRFEARFKKQLNENTIREIANFQAQLNNEHHRTEERIELINKSMSAIEYNSGRYIKLETLSSTDSEVRGFRQELKKCTEGSIGGETTEQYTEEKFLQVKSIVDRFKGREGLSEIDRKWTTKVTDVRNWFAFAASERWIEDDSEYEHYTDSGGKSGGQKEKLAYTVLSASLAYQFGLEWGEVRSRSFRFVVIDEAFGRGSDESTRFGLKLFKQLNLQFLLITPLQKINIIEPYVASIGFVHNENGQRSLLRTISIEEYRQNRDKAEDTDR